MNMPRFTHTTHWDLSNIFNVCRTLALGSCLGLLLEVFRNPRTIGQFVSKSGSQTNQDWAALLHSDRARPLEPKRFEIAINVDVNPRFVAKTKICKISEVAERQ